MQITPSDIHFLYRPSECEGRLFLRRHGTPEDEASPYEDVLHALGVEHERAFVRTLDVVDLSALDLAEREVRTRELVSRGDKPLYQPSLSTSIVLDGTSIDVLGVPDLIQFDNGAYWITDCKMSRRISEKEHPEIVLTLQLYGWIAERALRKPPKRLEVFSGLGEVVEVPAAPGAVVEALLRRIVTATERPEKRYEPVGWSRCGSCCYHTHCWTKAQADGDVALVPGIDVELARVLHASGVPTIQSLVSEFADGGLENVVRPWGNKTQRVGTRSSSILAHARSLASGTEMWLSPLTLPHGPVVMFDLEGLPPHLDETDKVYLWGIQVFGTGKPSTYRPAVAGFGPDGDKEGWNTFLA